MNNVWHDNLAQPAAGRMILIYNPATRTPTMTIARDCVRIMTGTIWAYVADLLPKEHQND